MPSHLRPGSRSLHHQSHKRTEQGRTAPSAPPWARPSTLTGPKPPHNPQALGHGVPPSTPSKNPDTADPADNATTRQPRQRDNATGSSFSRLPSPCLAIEEGPRLSMPGQKRFRAPEHTRQRDNADNATTRQPTPHSRYPRKDGVKSGALTGSPPLAEKKTPSSIPRTSRPRRARLSSRTGYPRAHSSSSRSQILSSAANVELPDKRAVPPLSLSQFSFPSLAVQLQQYCSSLSKCALFRNSFTTWHDARTFPQRTLSRVRVRSSPRKKTAGSTALPQRFCPPGRCSSTSLNTFLILMGVTSTTATTDTDTARPRTLRRERYCTLVPRASDGNCRDQPPAERARPATVTSGHEAGTASGQIPKSGPVPPANARGSR